MNALANAINAYTYAVAVEKGMWGLAGLVIGVLLTAVINGMAKRDDFARRLDALDEAIDSVDDSLDVHELRLDSIEEARPHDPPSKADVDAAMDMLRFAKPAPNIPARNDDEDEPVTWPSFKSPGKSLDDVKEIAGLLDCPLEITNPHLPYDHP